MKDICLRALLIVAMPLSAICQKTENRKHTLAGDIRYHKNFHSRFLGNDRDIIVYLPPGYEKTRRHFPVFYMHDGQNIFDGATSYVAGQEWRVDESAESLIRSGQIEPLIIVGIYNTGEERPNEYLFTKVEGEKAGPFPGKGGKAGLYGRMVVEELKPFIDSTYRTRKEAQNTAVGGSSFGGNISLYLGLKYPRVFGKLALISTGLWWDDKLLVRDVSALSTKLPLRIWHDMGTRELDNKELDEEWVKDARLLRDAFVAQGWALNKDLKYVEAEGARHSEQAWSERVPSILKFLFPKK